MLDAQLWTTGSTTMLVGMGIVFMFLVILIFAIMIAAKCISAIDKLFPPVVEEVKTTKKAKTSDDSEIAIAIAAALARA